MGLASVAVEFPELAEAGLQVVDGRADFLSIRRNPTITDWPLERTEFPRIGPIRVSLGKVGLVGEKQTASVWRPRGRVTGHCSERTRRSGRERKNPDGTRLSGALKTADQ